MPRVAAFAAPSPGARLVPTTIDRRTPGPHDVRIDVLFCGVCHSDIHQVRDEWAPGLFPMVPGHEIVGRVGAVGASVTRFAVGALVGVGCMVDSCRACGPCRRGEEQFCDEGCAYTYNSTEMDRVTPTHGGYSRQVVVDEHFVVRVPGSLDPAAAAPLLCAGVTTWSPLREWNVGPGTSVGVVGLGGLGHMGVQLAAALGAEVTVLSTSRAKAADAARLGAHGFELVSGDGTPASLAGRFDVVLDTVSASHDVAGLLGTLRPHGALVMVGAPPQPLSVPAFALIGGNSRLAGSSIGSMRQTQEVLDFCAGKGIASHVERIPIQSINEAYERAVRGDVRYRFVIDLASLPEA